MLDLVGVVLFVLWVCISAVPFTVTFVYWHRIKQKKQDILTLPIPVLLSCFLFLFAIGLYSVVKLFSTRDNIYAALALGCALAALLVHELVNA